MKNIKYCLFGILTSLSLCNVVNAATLELKTDDKLVINEKSNITVNVNLKLDENEELENITFDLVYGDANFENGTDLLSITDNKNSFGYLSNYIGSTATVLKLPEKSFADGTIMSFTVTNISSEDGTAQMSLKNIKVKPKDGEIKNIEDEVKPLNMTLKKEVTTTTRALNTSAELKGFKANNNATIKPAFSKDVKEYKIYVKDTLKQVTITPQYEETGVQMEVECTLGCTPDTSAINKLNVIQGKNEATFTFTSEDGKNKNSYKFIIYRGPTTDGSNLLSSLSFEEDVKLNEKFDKSSLDYTVTVPYNIEKLKVVATPEDSSADVDIKGSDSLSVGENVITVTVTSAETMEKKIYNITVTREDFVPEEQNTTVVTPTIEKEEPKSNNNNMKLIIIIGVISTLIIALAAYFIFFFKGKKKKKNKEELSAPRIQNDLLNEDKEPTSVEDALIDLMKTREMTEVNDDKPTLK